MDIFFRGTSDAHGVPRLYCECAVCTEARTSPAINRRMRPSIHLMMHNHDPIWVDCGPDWYAQMEQSGTRVVQHMLITHAHFDHIGGLPQWYDQCRYVEQPAYLYAASEVIEAICERFPWLSQEINFISIDEGITFGEWNLVVWRVNHGRNGYSYALKFQHLEAGTSIVYCPDSINLTEEQQAPIYQSDVLIIGTSFYQEPYPMDTRSLYDVTEVIELQQSWNAKRVYLTHLSHDIDITKRSTLPPNMYYAQVEKPIKLT